jgi:hypothetical protein
MGLTNANLHHRIMSTIRDSAAVESWSGRHGKQLGDVRPVEQIWQFAREWYGRHLDFDWRKWTSGEAAAMFEKHGLEGPMWTLPSHGERF